MRKSTAVAEAKVKSPEFKAPKATPAKSVPVQAPEIDLSGIFMPGGGLRTHLREADHPWQRRHKLGKALRERTPRESHSNGKPVSNRPDPLDLLAASNVGRQKDLIPLRMGRMAASPFTFLRGAACVMAWDLSRTPNSGIRVIIDGDAHINNFGLYGTPQRDVIFDLNDFDEATIGPWEWDLKRLVASINVAARENGLDKVARTEAVLHAVDGYRWNIDRLKSMGVLDVWYLHAYPNRESTQTKMDAKMDAKSD